MLAAHLPGLIFPSKIRRGHEAWRVGAQKRDLEEGRPPCPKSLMPPPTLSYGLPKKPRRVWGELCSVCILLPLLPVLGSAWSFHSQHTKWPQSLPPLESILPQNNFSLCAKQRVARGETARLGLFPGNTSFRREKGHSEPSADPPSTG